MPEPTIAIIVAALKNGGIGFQGKMPWRLRKEIKYFKDVTSRTSSPNSINAVLMGRKTWESIPKKFRPLPDRINIILSRSSENKILDGIIYSNSIGNSLSELEKYSSQSSKVVERIFVIGGAEIYNELINDNRVSHLLITDIDHKNDVEVDTFLKFPMYTKTASDWVKQGKADLQEFIGDEITINEDIQEGDFLYNYTLWKKV